MSKGPKVNAPAAIATSAGVYVLVPSVIEIDTNCPFSTSVTVPEISTVPLSDKLM